MERQREFFPSVQKTVMPRPYFGDETDILGQSGTAWAVDAAIYGSNFFVDRGQGLVEIYDAGPAISFHHLLPHKDKYKKEGLYLRLKLAYRTTANANVNIRNFSGNHVTLPNSFYGDIYDDLDTYWWVSDDLTLNINSIFSGEKLWLQRVDWEWMSKEVVYEDELQNKDLVLHRSFDDIEKLYSPQNITDSSVKDFLMEKIKNDDQFAKCCLLILRQDQLMNEDLTKLFEGIAS
ncbi:hypothetical protein [Aphanothece sacrum]|uniref:Uncharacterized protein n=1 Tax=Aphanothece sacrum FPU1 TaxID=1920663 RepID=A0A401IBW3_APHSA|nr:hypothetical protein [Aphanothece sacrum]GBF78773.1 hypothetical protein AsFPU1_0162 [Aphanothece sacrum FPU1]GBF83005.1 hypothetical protein AsFPU3_0042 [Aphanothece sacrum FPU3]